MRHFDKEYEKNLNNFSNNSNNEPHSRHGIDSLSTRCVNSAHSTASSCDEDMVSGVECCRKRFDPLPDRRSCSNQQANGLHTSETAMTDNTTKKGIRFRTSNGVMNKLSSNSICTDQNRNHSLESNDCPFSDVFTENGQIETNKHGSISEMPYIQSDKAFQNSVRVNESDKFEGSIHSMQRSNKHDQSKSNDPIESTKHSRRSAHEVKPKTSNTIDSSNAQYSIEGDNAQNPLLGGVVIDETLQHSETRRKHENEHQHLLDEMQQHLQQNQSIEMQPTQVFLGQDGRGTRRIGFTVTFRTLIYFSIFSFLLGRFNFSISWLLLLFLAIWTMYKTKVNYFTPLYAILRSMNLNFWEETSISSRGRKTPERRARTRSLLQALGERDSNTQFQNLRSVRRRLEDSFATDLSPIRHPTPRLSESALPINFILSSLWSTWNNANFQNWLNELIDLYKEHFSSYIEQIEVTYVNMKPSPESAPVITEIRCVSATLERTVFELDIEYCGDFKMEWFMRPRVLPLNLRCMVKEVVLEATLRLEMEYESTDDSVIGQFGEINISFIEYPRVLDASIQMFDSLVFHSIAGSIPAVTRIIKRKFDEVLSLFIYPNTFTIQESPTKQHSPRDNIPLHFGMEPKNLNVMEDIELEDEIRNVILDINNLLKTKLQGTNSDAVKKEVTTSVLQFLKYGTQPGRIPVSMMELIKRGFQILNQLAFDDQKQGEICLPVFEEIIHPENFELIGHVARVGTLADNLIVNIMKLKSKKLQSQVNKTLEQLNMQDIIWTVLSRNSIHST